MLGNLAQPQGRPRSISSLYLLVNSSVAVPGGTSTTVSSSISSNNRGTVANTTVTTTTTTIIVPSPLNDPSQQSQLLPLLLDQVTTSQKQELPARININTAPLVVMQALQAAVNLQDSDVQQIQSKQPDPSSANPPDDSYKTLTWLVTQANLSPTTLKALDKYITARTGVYRMQVQGYFDNGTASRVEAVIDTYNGRPRVVYWRPLIDHRAFPNGLDGRAGINLRNLVYATAQRLARLIRNGCQRLIVVSNCKPGSPHCHVASAISRIRSRAR